MISTRGKVIAGAVGAAPAKDLVCRQICSIPVILVREVVPSTPVGTMMISATLFFSFSANAIGLSVKIL